MRTTFKIPNVPKMCCDHVVGKKHTKKHRMIAGAMFMFTGVFIAEVIGSVSHYFTFMCNVVGYAIHGMGVVPFIEEDFG